MSKRPSEATLLRTMRADLRASSQESYELRRTVAVLRGQLTQAQQDAAAWRKRFDDLLARVPLAPLAAARPDAEVER